MAAFVPDTSIALKWFLEDEGDRAYSMAITDDYRPAVPWLWYYEIANSDQGLVRAAADARVPILKLQD